MHLNKNAALQRKLHEERLLAQRLMVFLLFHSILFLGFATLLRSGADKLLLTVPIIGIIASLFLFLFAFSVKVELDALDKLLREPERSVFSKVIRGANAGFLLALFFLAIWIVSLF